MAGPPRRQPPARREFKFVSSEVRALAVASINRAQCRTSGIQGKPPTNANAIQFLIQLTSNRFLNSA
jgi:hypothetical protein